MGEWTSKTSLAKVGKFGSSDKFSAIFSGVEQGNDNAVSTAIKCLCDQEMKSDSQFQSLSSSRDGCWLCTED